MNKRITILLAISSVFLVFVLVMVAGVGVNQATAPANETSEVTLAAGSGFVFEGCWAYFPAGQCYDIYRNAQGNYWICSKCGQTKNPGPKVCRTISELTLSRGYWCS